MALHSVTTMEQALAKRREREPFMIEGLISSTSTLIYGEAKSGKSMLVAGIVAALGGDATEFLEHKVIRRAIRPAVIWTDDDGDLEYAERISSVAPSVAVEFYGVGVMKELSEWVDLHAKVRSAGRDLVVIDNMGQAATGTLNDDGAVRAFYEGVRLFVRDGIPVIVVAHSSEKAGEHGKSRMPMGSSMIRAGARWLCFVQARTGGDLVLEFHGNQGDNHTLTLAMPDRGRPVYEVVDATSGAEKRGRSRDRRRATLDQHHQIGAWVVENCQGQSALAASKAVAEQFGGSAGTHRNRLQQGAYGVHRTEGSTWLSSVG